MPISGPALRSAASLRRPRFRGLLVLTVLALVVQATLVIGGSAADEGCSGSTTGVFSLDSALAAGEPCADLKVSPSQVPEGQSVSFDASASKASSGATIASYQWDFEHEGTFAADLTTTTATQPVLHTYPTPGVKRATVRVTDNQGRSSDASVTVTVCPTQNTPPTADYATSAPAVVGEQHTFDASASGDPDPCGSVTRYEWDFDGNGTFETDAGTDKIAVRTFAQAGPVNVGLRVTDNRGATAQHVAPLVVTTRPTARLVAMPATISPGQTITFDGSTSSDPEGPIVRYQWDLNNDGTFERDTGATPTTSQLFNAAGSYTVGLRVTDAAGATGTLTVSVLVRNLAPSPSISISPSPVAAGQSVLLDASASTDADGSVTSYDWDLDGNGSFETSSGAAPTLTHAYPNAGSFDVGVRVRDNHGATGVASAQLTVGAPADGGSGGAGGTGGTEGSAGSAGAGAGVGGAAEEPAGGASGSASSQGRAFAAALTAQPVQRRRTIAKRGLAVACQANRAARCNVSAMVSAKDARRLGLGRQARRPVALGSASVALRGAGTATLVIKLTRKAQRALRKARKVRVLVAGVATGGADRASLGGTVIVRR